MLERSTFPILGWRPLKKNGFLEFIRVARRFLKSTLVRRPLFDLPDPETPCSVQKFKRKKTQNRGPQSDTPLFCKKSEKKKKKKSPSLLKFFEKISKNFPKKGKKAASRRLLKSGRVTFWPKAKKSRPSTILAKNRPRVFGQKPLKSANRPKRDDCVVPF